MKGTVLIYANHINYVPVVQAEGSDDPPEKANTQLPKLK